LVVLCETNVLNLISQRLDTIYQIKPKRATVLFLHLFAELNTRYDASTPKVLVTAWADMHPPVDATSSGSSLHMLKNWMSSPNPSDWSQEQKMIT
jgi:hypothetical protein